MIILWVSFQCNSIQCNPIQLVFVHCCVWKCRIIANQFGCCIALHCQTLLSAMCCNSWPYLIFVIFFTLAYFKAKQVYTKKFNTVNCILYVKLHMECKITVCKITYYVWNVQNDTFDTSAFIVENYSQSKIFTLAPLLMLATNIRYACWGVHQRVQCTMQLY